jgi:acetoin utilization deacetylase AcuC-like enzyme
LLAPASWIEAEIPQKSRSDFEELQRIARFFCPLRGQKIAPKFSAEKNASFLIFYFPSFLVFLIFAILGYMILYNPATAMNMLDFGILIPIRYDKHRMIYDALKNGALKDIPENLWRHTPVCFGIIGQDDLLRVHSRDYVDRLYSAGTIDREVILTYELVNPDGTYNRWDPSKAVRPLKDLFERALGTTGGVWECGITALDEHAHSGLPGFAYYFGGGMHHAMRDTGEGFCLINDVVISLRKLQAEGRVRTAWVIDMDAHKGDGTAALTRGDDSIRTLSIHMDKGWPLDAPEYDGKGVYNLSYTPSDIDIGIPEGGEPGYVPRLREGIFQMERDFPKPDIVLVVGGVDPYEKDELASTKPLRLTKEALLERDIMVYKFLQDRNIPAAWITAGGYGPHSWEVYANFLSQVIPERLKETGGWPGR